MKNFFLPLLLFAFIFSSCSKDKDVVTPAPTPAAPLPVACFTINKNWIGLLSDTFSFFNCSQNAVRYEWDFGDLTYAPVPNPLHVYNQRNTFIVRMTAYNSDNISSTATDTIFIRRYSLEKIIYRQTSSLFTPPYYVSLFYPAFIDTIFSSTLLPVTHDVADTSLYDVLSSSINYAYKEAGGAGVIIHPFIVDISEIKNYHADVLLPRPPGEDTVKITLYYRIVDR